MSAHSQRIRTPKDEQQGWQNKQGQKDQIDHSLVLKGKHIDIQDNTFPNQEPQETGTHECTPWALKALQARYCACFRTASGHFPWDTKHSSHPTETTKFCTSQFHVCQAKLPALTYPNCKRAI
eukprot:644593-Pelagomonas_calceolata.AAC.1